MSHLLWKYFYEDDVDKFRHLLAPAGHNSQTSARSTGIGSFSKSPGSFGTSPRASVKGRKSSAGPGAAKNAGYGLTRADVNVRDNMGLTILLRVSSSTEPSAVHFVQALLGHPGVDIYAQDLESGWNALHRALYNGNVSIAQLLLQKERRDLTEFALGTSISRVGHLINTKDKDGNSPFDLYNETIGNCILKRPTTYIPHRSEFDSRDDDSDEWIYCNDRLSRNGWPLDGEELFVWGSNKNLSLGVGEDSDRQYPERINTLTRPDHLLFRFYCQVQKNISLEPPSIEQPSTAEQFPDLVRHHPILVHDVAMAKFSTAIVTNDPVSNLYICGIGLGGRLGLGNENTQFKFVPIQGPLRDKNTAEVALADFHSMAAMGNGELWTWGSNTYSQLGYHLPPTSKKGEIPMVTSPRQVFGALKKEVVVGIAASAIHSVAHTATSVYCWGKNVGQLGIMAADSRSLEVQTVPRRVAASLFTCGITMVSAIEKATSVLLKNNAVCVFTEFGYKIVKFPFDELVNNNSLSNVFMSSRNDPLRLQIKYIASGGSSIVALTARGDLFNCEIQAGPETNEGTSTTNPTKIKNALGKPQCIWVASKDGVNSVDVGENGSVIIATESGACWQRVKRQTSKTGYTLGPATKRKDFKFQRVPYITNILKVRSSTFGAFAAIRKDSDVVRHEMTADKPTLLQDISGLCCLEGIKASTPANTNLDAIQLDSYQAKALGPTAAQILQSPDIESDIATHLQFGSINRSGMDVLLRTSSCPHIEIPVHGFILAARSLAFRNALSVLRKTGEYLDKNEVFDMEIQGDKILATLSSVDIWSLLNMIIFAYKDKVVPVWSFVHQNPTMAYTFRKVRLEVMKLGSAFGMAELEAAARFQRLTGEALNADFCRAILDPEFFEDGDIRLRLDGDEVILAHSSFLCCRSPFFQALIHGRSQGAWIEGRREEDPDNHIPVDFAHMSRLAFDVVLRYLYADIGTGIFYDIVSANIDEFAEVVLEVMGIANELMLDRLVQLSQYIIGKFVSTRNIGQLLNEISPCYVTEFKHAGLEYICRQLEGMLENNLLSKLEDDLMHELDQKVRENQAARLPVSRSNMAELDLHDRYPSLEADIDEERQVRIKEMAYFARIRDGDRRLSSSTKARYGSFDDITSISPMAEQERKKSRPSRNEPFSPTLRPQGSANDFIFDMDEDKVVADDMISTPIQSLDFGAKTWPKPGDPTPGSKDKAAEFPTLSSSCSPLVHRSRQVSIQTAGSPHESSNTQGKSGTPWGLSGLQPIKLGLEKIMSEAGPSALTTGLAAEKQKDKHQAPKAVPAKVSQKERKRQQQLQLEQVEDARGAAGCLKPQDGWETVGGKASPWKATPVGVRANLKDILANGPAHSPPPASTQQRPIAVAESSAAKLSSRRTTSPDTRFSGQSRTVPAVAGPSNSTIRMPPSTADSIPPKKRKPQTTRAEPTLLLGLTDIIGQQEREQELVRDAVAKRSLQEIQQEQAFQEWWDQESRRTQDEEARRLDRENEKGERERQKTKNRRGRNRGRGGRPRRGGGGQRGADVAVEAAGNAQGGNLGDGGDGGGPSTQ